MTKQKKETNKSVLMAIRKVKILVDLLSAVAPERLRDGGPEGSGLEGLISQVCFGSDYFLAGYLEISVAELGKLRRRHPDFDRALESGRHYFAHLGLRVCGYDPYYHLPVVERLVAIYNHDNEVLAHILGVPKALFDSWIKDHTELSEAIERGQEAFRLSHKLGVSGNRCDGAPAPEPVGCEAICP